MAVHLFTMLRKHRKRHAFSQRDVAYLLGSSYSDMISNYETRGRIPCLQKAMALSIILDTPLAELFPDMHETIQNNITHHAHQLLQDIPDGPKRKRLKEIIASGD